MIFVGYWWTHKNLKRLNQSFFWIYQYGYLSVAVMVQSIIKCSFGDTAVPDLNQHEGTVIMLLHKFHMNFYQVKSVVGKCCIFEIFAVYLNIRKKSKIEKRWSLELLPCLCCLFSLEFSVAGRPILEFGVSFYFWLSLLTQAWKKISLHASICCDLAFAVHAVVIMYFESSLLTSYPTLLLNIKDRWWFFKGK